MKWLKQFGIILAISFLGEVLHALLPLPIPASIYGIVMLFLTLECKIIPLHAVKEGSAFLIEIMPVMFIPAAVGLLESWNVLRPNWMAYILITAVTTVLVMGISGLATQWVIRSEKGKEAEKHG